MPNHAGQVHGGAQERERAGDRAAGRLGLRCQLQPPVSQHLRAVVANVGQAVHSNQRGHVIGRAAGHHRRQRQLAREAPQGGGGLWQHARLARRGGYLGDGAVEVHHYAQPAGAQQRCDGVEVGQQVGRRHARVTPILTCPHQGGRDSLDLLHQGGSEGGRV